MPRGTPLNPGPGPGVLVGVKLKAEDKAHLARAAAERHKSISELAREILVAWLDTHPEYTHDHTRAWR